MMQAAKDSIDLGMIVGNILKRLLPTQGKSAP
jgi:hypothetical protein